MTTGWMGGWTADATWLGWAGSRTVSIGHLRPGLIAFAAVLSVLAILEAAYIVWLRRHVAADRQAEVTARLDNLTAALALLTDTTEAGLSALAVEVQRAQQRQPDSRVRSRRIVAKGASSNSSVQIDKPVTRAAAEMVSVDEVQLQAALAAAVVSSGESRDDLRA